MQILDQTEVLVAGAGPVGMMAAILLAKNGIHVRVIDQEQQTATHSYACVLHPRSLNLLHQAGVAQEAIRLGNRIDTIRFYEGRSCRAEVAFSELPVQFPFALVLKQGTLEQLLEQELKQFEHVEVGWNHRLADLGMKEGTAIATIEELALSGKGYVLPEFEWEVQKTSLLLAQYVLGADGHNSLIRQRMNVPCQPAGEPALFVMYNVECERQFGHKHEIRIGLDQNRISAMWPFSDVDCRWGFQWIPADEPGNFPEKDRSPFIVVEPPSKYDSRHHLQRLLRMRAPWFESGIKEVEWATDIQFEHWLVAEFGRDRCWLAGDAAHQTGPVGMQSMNAGLWEAADLAAKLKQILREGGSPELLNDYDREHRAEWQELLGMSGPPKPTEYANDWVRKHLAQILASLPASGKELAHLLNRLGLELEPAHMHVLHERLAD
jgi:2-polyprenyl-6-methoxyphenol hydroxylase-like FAD-dependent oxidoreductase